MEIGDKIPDFTAKTDKGNQLSTSDLVGNPCVIYFYPKNETKGCTAQACSFRDSYEDFKEIGAEVVGISHDSVESHQSFKEHHRLPYILLSDKDKTLRSLFSVKGDLLGLIPGRETFVFNAKGVLIYKFRSQMKIEDHIQNALTKLKEQNV